MKGMTGKILRKLKSITSLKQGLIFQVNNNNPQEQDEIGTEIEPDFHEFDRGNSGFSAKSKPNKRNPESTIDPKIPSKESQSCNSHSDPVRQMAESPTPSSSISQAAAIIPSDQNFQSFYGEQAHQGIESNFYEIDRGGLEISSKLNPKPPIDHRPHPTISSKESQPYNSQSDPDQQMADSPQILYKSSNLSSSNWAAAGGNNSIVLYTTSLRGIRKTFEDCKTVRFLLQSFRVRFQERDVSMDMAWKDELWTVSGGRVVPPRLFVRGKYVGGADEVVQLHEEGDLRRLLQGLPVDDSGGGPCDGCGGAGFVLCSDCSGSCKIISEENDLFVKCPNCNENGLVRCPICIF